MYIEGRIVPALKLEVDKNAYEIFKREQWMQEHQYRIENRCIISGKNGKARFCPIRIPNPSYTPDNSQPKTLANSCSACPHNNKFNLPKGKVCFSTLSITDKDGNILGQHKGIISYTVGQRKGLGIAAGKPVYVTRICPEENRVILGDNEDLFHRELDVEDFNFISFENPPAEFRAKAKVRYRQKEQWATVKVTGDRSVHIIFDEPQRAITKGQAAVLYDGDVVIGGGVIKG